MKLSNTPSKGLSPHLWVQRKSQIPEFIQHSWAGQVNKVPGKLEVVKEIGFG